MAEQGIEEILEKSKGPKLLPPSLLRDAAASQLRWYWLLVNNSRLWQRGFVCFYELQILFLYALGLYDRGAFPEDEEMDKVKIDSKASFSQTLSLCKQDFISYFRLCRSLNISILLLSLPLVSWIMLITAFSSLLLPHVFRKRFNFCYEEARKRFLEPRALRDLALNIRPMVLCWLLVVPVAQLVMMIQHGVASVENAVKKVKIAGSQNKSAGLQSTDIERADSPFRCLKLTQFREEKQSNIDFFHSPVFPMLLLSVFVSGIPYFALSWVFTHANLHPFYAAMVKNPRWSEFSFIHFYIYPLSWCLMTLFFRSYFCFPWNFASRENIIEVYDDVIKSLPIKGWFRDFIFLRLEHIPFEIAWKDVVSIKYISKQLSSSQLNEMPPLLMPFLKLYSCIEGITNNLNLVSDYLEISDDKRVMNIRLVDMSKEEKAELLFCLRKNAPSVFLDGQVQEALVGSRILKEPQYTQIWFDVFRSRDSKEEKPPLAPSDRLNGGAYTVLERLGSGGQAVIYLASENKTECQVILKEYQLVEGEALDVLIESARSFENESSLLSQLDHDSIVKQKSIFYENGRVYLVLEYIEGKNLRELVESTGALSADKVVELAQQMAEILIYLHSQNPPITHRDFTPDNLILSKEGKLKLVDFSVAQSAKSLRGGESAGKHAYCAPEQFRAEACPQSDIYAFGATLYYLLSGRDPEPITCSKACPAEDTSIAKSLGKIIEQCTKLSLEERCQSAEWLQSELKELRADLLDSSSSLSESRAEIISLTEKLKQELELELQAKA